MQTTRKIQLGAVAVIANSLLALTVLGPRPAFANPCAPIQQCIPGNTCTNGNYTALCQSLAQPGCTTTSNTCGFSGACDFDPPVFIGFQVTCNYN